MQASSNGYYKNNQAKNTNPKKRLNQDPPSSKSMMRPS